MKALYFLCFAFISVSLFSQASQKEIPDYVLVGKTADELNLMRNEIYASYGLIFKSEQLQKYFKQKKWYQPKYDNVDSFLSEMDQKNIQLIKAEEKNLRSEKYELMFSNESKVSIRKYRDPEFDYSFITKTTTVDYYETYHMGMIKTVSETTDFGGEGRPTVMYAETIDPKIPYWHTTKYCQAITYFPYYYQTFEYGCCSGETYHEFYNYNSEVPFLKTNENFFLIEIPNGGLQLFLGYNHSICNIEDLSVAELSLATMDGVINTIKFKAKNRLVYEAIDAFWSPEIELISAFPENKVILNNRMTVWSKNFEKDLNKVSDFSVRITYTSQELGKMVYEFPIENGLLNGVKGEQLITIELK